MNLIWITPECPFPPNTGGKVGFMKRIEYMAKYNDIYLLTIIDNEDELKYKENLELFCKEVHMFPRNSLFNSIWQCFAFPYQAVSRWNQALCNKYNELCKFITPEYVIVDSPQMMGVVLKNKEVLKKVILNQHNIEYKTLFSLSKTKKNLIQKIAFIVTGLQMQLYEANLYRNNIYLYTFVSKSDKLLFEKKYNKKNTLLVPVGTEIKDDVKIVNTQNILFVGKLSYSPNEEGILWFIDNVFNKILDSCCNASLYIVGKNPTKEILKRATINKNIIVTGPVDNLDEYYDIVDLVIVPIFSGGGVNVKLIEALGQGKSIVTTSKGLNGTGVISGKEVYSADNSQQYANYCIDIISNPSKHLQMRKNALLKAKKNYSWDKVINDFNIKLENG